MLHSMRLCVCVCVCMCRFGTFLCNCDKERHKLSLYATTASIWAHLMAEKDKLINPEYVPSKQVLVYIIM